MLLSARQAAGVLLREGGIARMQARRLLAAGLAGPGVPSAGAVLYEQTAVQTLAVRPLLDLDELAAVCPHGLVIARIDRARRVDTATGWEGLAADLSAQQAMPPLTRALLAARMAAYGSVPWVETLCGHVVLGADALSVRAAGPDSDGTVAFTLTRPALWFDAIDDRVLPTGRGGRPCVIWTPR
jgi:hypothetical protein